MDLPGRRLLFGETPESQTPYEYDASGMFVVSAAHDFHHFEVLSVVAGGPAATAGIEKGDVIVELEGEPASRWTLERVRGAIREVNGTRTLKVRRNGREIDVRLQLRNQV